MAIREILEVPDPRLKIISKPVETFDESLKALVDDMFETMYAARGIGLAAIQVGEPLRLLVIDLQEPDPDAEPEQCHGHHGHDGDEPHTHQPVKNDPRIFVNPEILDPDPEVGTYQEGCLSVPEIYADVDRPKTCRVRWQDLEGNVHEEAMEGLLAICIQHEMDHLNGILFIDHLSRLKRNMALKKLDKLRKAA
jgi:peptide deformylase